MDFLDFFWTFMDIFFYFYFFFGIFWIFGYIWIFGFFEFFEFLWIFFGFFFSRFLGVSFKVTKVTTKCYSGYYWTPKIAKKGPKQQQQKNSFFARRAKKASAESHSPPQELEVGLRSGPYLLVICNNALCIVQCSWYCTTPSKVRHYLKTLQYYSLNILPCTVQCSANWTV